MKVCIREESDWRVMPNARVEFTLREIQVLARSGPDAYRLAGGEVVILPEPKVSIHAHKPVEGKS